MSRGGILRQTPSSDIRISNCTISRNSVHGNGGGIYYHSTSIMSIMSIITNCTIADNVATYSGGGILCQSGFRLTLNNTIIWGNRTTNGNLRSGNEIYDENEIGARVSLNYCDFADGAGDIVGTVPDPNCIRTDPQFVDAAVGNYRLQPTSPCIDAGDNSFVPAGITTDLDGNPRIVDGNTPPDGTATVDIGAYEYQP